MRCVKTERWIAFDTETTGLDHWGEVGVDREFEPVRPFMFSFADEYGKEFFYEGEVDPFTRKVTISDEVRNKLKKIIENPNITKVCHNVKFDRHMCEAIGLKTRGKWHCTKVAAQIAAPHLFNFSLKPVCEKLFGFPADDESSLKDAVKAARRVGKEKGYCLGEEVEQDYWLALDECRKYAVNDAKRCVLLYKAFLEQATRKQKREYKFEMSLLNTIYRMEKKGIVIDPDKCEELSDFYEDIAQKHRQHLPKGLNLKSPKQMTKYFFGDRGYTPLEYSWRKAKPGKIAGPVYCLHCKGDGCEVCQFTGRNPKCNGDFLASIGIKYKDGDPVMDDREAWHILHYQASSAMQDFIDQYLTLSVREDETNCLVVHSTINTKDTRTGRLNSKSPNLQNIASDSSSKKKTAIPYRPREIFIPRPGCLFYIPDYSQIEVWVLALLSGDKSFIQALEKGGDAHQNVADMVWGEEAANDPDLKNKIRKRAKNLQFCIIYGGGVDLVAKMIGCTVDEAQVYMDEYHRRIPAVKRFMDKCMKDAAKYGYVESPFGVRYVVDRGFEYRATNYIIQGTAAMVAKRAMVNLDRHFQKFYDDEVSLLLQIHDEFAIEVPEKHHSQELMEEIDAIMGLDGPKLGASIPFPVGFKVAKDRWSNAEEISIGA